jgi:hypothetical protein
VNAQSKIAGNSLASAMALAFAEIEAATKSANNPHFKSKYADLSAIIEAVKPALINHGLFFTQHCHPSPDGVSVETVLGHASGEERSLGTLYVPANKKDAQGFGSALTYARRYALMTAFGVPAEDDDGNAAARSVQRTNGKAEDTGELVNDEQLGALQGMASAVGADLTRFCAYYKIDSLKDIRAADYQGAMDALKAKAKPKQKEPA